MPTYIELINIVNDDTPEDDAVISDLMSQMNDKQTVLDGCRINYKGYAYFKFHVKGLISKDKLKALNETLKDSNLVVTDASTQRGFMPPNKFDDITYTEESVGYRAMVWTSFTIEKLLV
ncbi:hypothetical protein [Pseudomonas aeruginosa]|uniref:hypothetical protein n=1 Tax=Pseudomonas aeruginosa TaxID=287 RepID=UPI001CA50D97|nr:hypothetical protein [Pseudomonas aeruginosa]MBW6070360.1 hypothetical protein [Pseudomonas aeruginosa]